ncbi:MAG: M20/M25/M40 family metallo-hydrolase [Ardenticatenaceae bacterium]|nr:M20/M25/M40 family metallo-hydrolase [Anaerolineales bacterium]MCB8939675.1 M20/M25/M40 family metallo-hydrolase [Ardenticatenaceae bacterium]MCB8974900.1 M20/M25/M40 family metallo-hydrolase [Ardenticatenaceae bacterium]
MNRKTLPAVLQAHFETNLPNYLDMLHQMVDINSFTAYAAGVNELGQLTAELFAKLGFEAEFVQSAIAHYGKHLVLTRNGRTNQTIGLVSHLDTVFPAEEEARNNFHWREDGDRIYGPGTVDIKGGTVLIYMMLEALQQHAPQQFEAVNWVILVDASEEAEAEDFGQLCIERLEGPDTLACLIFEGGSKVDDTYQVVVARKGMAIFQVKTEGRAAHAGSYHPQGVNAVVQMAHTILKLAALTDYERQITVNVGTMRGGVVTNRVPHEAESWLEMRTFRPDTFAETVANILALNGQPDVRSSVDGYASAVDINLYRQTPPWARNEATDRLFSVWQQTGQALGFTVLPEERGGLSDGNHFWQRVPALDGLGPSGVNAHCSERSEDGSKDQEYVMVSSFVPKATLNTMAVLNLLGAFDG